MIKYYSILDLQNKIDFRKEHGLPEDAKVSKHEVDNWILQKLIKNYESIQQPLNTQVLEDSTQTVKDPIENAEVSPTGSTVIAPIDIDLIY